MTTDRKLAIATGVMFIVATVGGLASTVLLQPVLAVPNYLASIALNENQVLLAALFQFIAGAACAGIAIAMYPVIRKQNEGLALGSVAFRVIEGTLYVLVTVTLLLLVSLSHESLEAGPVAASAVQIPGALLMAARDWLGPVGAVLTFGLAAAMYYWVFYRSRLIPRWLSIWGFVGAALLTVSGLLVMFRLAEPLGTAQTAMAAPIAIQEMVLAVWLLAKGFSLSALTGQSAVTSRASTTTPSPASAA
jgi:hypothetical protein